MNTNSGKLDLIVGPMFSGKSVRLMQHLIVSSELGLKVLYINHTFDTRSASGFSTHHPFLTIKQYEGIDFMSASSLKGLNKEEYDVIGIDEAQFFDDSLLSFCQTHVEIYKRHVIVVGLDSNYKRERFGYVLDLIPFCDTIKKISSYCEHCGNKKVKAMFTYKLVKDYTGIVDVGGKNKYVPLCRNCYLECEMSH